MPMMSANHGPQFSSKYQVNLTLLAATIPGWWFLPANYQSMSLGLVLPTTMEQTYEKKKQKYNQIPKMSQPPSRFQPPFAPTRRQPKNPRPPAGPRALARGR